MQTSVQRFLAAAIQAGKLENFLKFGSVGHLFTGEEEKLWNYFDGHVKKYGTFPDYQLIKADTGYDLSDQPQPAEFYLDRAKENHIQQTLMTGFTGIFEKYLKPGISTTKPSDGLKEAMQLVVKLASDQLGQQVLDFREAYELIMSAYKSKWMQNGNTGIMTGWPTLDALTGGLTVGDLISFCGRPASGKTFLLLFIALHSWMQGMVPLFVSMEIKPLPIQQRLLAMRAKLPAKGIREAALSTEQFDTMKAVLAETQKGETPFYIVDGNLTATVGDIYALTRQLKPDFVVIDGAYLLSHPTEKDRYRRVAENCNLIKKQICDLVPTFCSWQFARPQKKNGGKKGGTPEQQTLDEIGYTDAIGQDSSLVCGMMQPDSVETSVDRTISILKGRNGETGEFKINWLFDWTTDFSEIVPPETSVGPDQDSDEKFE
jgi:replicative DNA helicase